jgi:uncharacterized protein YndB with AHSA1/START domain
MTKSTTKEPFVIERVYNASIQSVWQAITDKEKMKEWYFDLSTFKAEPGFEFTFYGGSETKQYLHRCKITEVIEGRKLSYTWAYDGYPGKSEVTFELFDENGQTRLKLTHAGLDTFSTDNPDFATTSFIQGWNHIIGESLKKFVEK